MRFFYVTLQAVSVTALSFVAYYSDDCSSGAGERVGIPIGSDVCIKCDDRHSFQLFHDDGDIYSGAQIGIFNNNLCGPGSYADGPDFPAYVGTCYNVNTGSNWKQASAHQVR